MEFEGAPVLEQGCRYKHLSVISAVTETGQFYYAIQEESFTGETVAQFLRYLYKEIRYPLLAVWDNASIHRAHEVKDFLCSENQGHIHLVAQPGYSPELNADEQTWNWLKYHELKNICCKTLAELKERVQEAAEKLKSKPSIVRGFFAHPALGFFMMN
jgi:transposase